MIASVAASAAEKSAAAAAEAARKEEDSPGAGRGAGGRVCRRERVKERSEMGIVYAH